MGIGNSRKWYAQPGEGPSHLTRHRSPVGEKHRRGRFRRRRSVTTTTLTSPTMVQPMGRRALYGSYSAMRPMPAPYPPISPTFMPMRYNNYSPPSYIPPQPMMLPASRAAPAMPAPYMALPAPAMSPPYMQPQQIPQPPPMQQPPIQPAYSGGPVPPALPASMSGGTGSYPLSYPAQPGRLMTDWTGGGKISPGFLGPPI